MRTPGIEPGTTAWKAAMMPLHHARKPQHYGDGPKW